MTNERERIINDCIRFFSERSTDMHIISDIDFSPAQLELLNKLCNFSVQRVLQEDEVKRDPRKIAYMTNHEMKVALAAILLTRVLINHLSLKVYTKEYFLKNILIYTDEKGNRHIDFMNIGNDEIKEALYDEIVYDWIIYRNSEGRGIRALSDEKTMNQGINDFKSGGDPIAEFARFQKFYFAEKQKQLKKDKESAQTMFRNTIIQQAAIEIAKQQLLSQQNPIELVNLLFNAKDYDQAINQILQGQNTISTEKTEVKAISHDKTNKKSKTKYVDMLEAAFQESENK